MARANRLRVDGGVFHVTHRCHNREFLLKFACDRNAYRAKLVEHLEQYEVWLLDYCVTSNHVHLVVDAPEREQLSGLMREVEGELAKAYNRRKGRDNAFWGDPYHATAVEGGDYLWRCVCYVELNMVRCGVVKHPRDWQWVGYHEIMGVRKRYRLLDLDRLCWRLGTESLEEVRKNLEASLAERTARHQMKREASWTESLAVGSAGFVEKFKPADFSRRELEAVAIGGGAWALREAVMPYGQKTGLKNARLRHRDLRCCGGTRRGAA
jgi:putative transposase